MANKFQQTFKEIKKTVKALDENLKKKDDAFKVSVLLLAGLHCQELEALVDFTGYSKIFIKQTAENLQIGGIWRDGKTYCNWDDEKTGEVEFWVDVNVGLGFLEKV